MSLVVLCKEKPERRVLLIIGATTIVGDRSLCVVIAVQCLSIRFALRREIAFSLCKENKTIGSQLQTHLYR